MGTGGVGTRCIVEGIKEEPTTLLCDSSCPCRGSIWSCVVLGLLADSVLSPFFLFWKILKADWCLGPTYNLENIQGLPWYLTDLPNRIFWGKDWKRDSGIVGSRTKDGSQMARITKHQVSFIEDSTHIRKHDNSAMTAKHFVQVSF